MAGKNESKQASFTCSQCGRTSYHPTDVAQGYCGACHSWTGPAMGWTPAGELVELLPWQAKAVRVLLGIEPGPIAWEGARGSGKSTVIETVRRMDPALRPRQLIPLDEARRALLVEGEWD